MPPVTMATRRRAVVLARSSASGVFLVMVMVSKREAQEQVSVVSPRELVAVASQFREVAAVASQEVLMLV